MKLKNLIVMAGLSVAIVLTGCNASSATKGGLIGGGAGAAVGAGVGALVAKNNRKKGALIGAAAGAAVGTTAGIIIGKKMDKKKKELEALQNAQVNEVQDQNGLKAIQVTFGEDGIKFATGKHNLSASAQANLKNFAKTLTTGEDVSTADITVEGHTDSTGSQATNEKVSAARAKAVTDFLVKNGVPASRITTRGLASEYPVADNSTVAGRAQNRRVEVYSRASQEMISAAEREKDSSLIGCRKGTELRPTLVSRRFFFVP